jgi:hypothetical protein
MTLVFENRDTVRFQIQEMVRIERIVRPDKVQEELDVYNDLLPRPGEVSATLFIEVTQAEKIQSTLDASSAWTSRESSSCGWEIEPTRPPSPRGRAVRTVSRRCTTCASLSARKAAERSSGAKSPSSKSATATTTPVSYYRRKRSRSCSETSKPKSFSISPHIARRPDR